MCPPYPSSKNIVPDVLYPSFTASSYSGAVYSSVIEVSYLISSGETGKIGKNILTRASALLEGSTAKERHNQIGGHRK